MIYYGCNNNCENGKMNKENDDEEEEEEKNLLKMNEKKAITSTKNWLKQHISWRKKKLFFFSQLTMSQTIS